MHCYHRQVILDLVWADVLETFSGLSVFSSDTFKIFTDVHRCSQIPGCSLYVLRIIPWCPQDVLIIS